MIASISKFHAWKVAEQLAYLAERKWRAAALARPADGISPASELAADLRQRRARAHALFLEAMQEMKDVAESLDSRKVLNKVSSDEVNGTP